MKGIDDPRWESVPTQEGDHCFRLTSTRFSSERYGPCELCGDHVSEVFMQTVAVGVLDSDGILFLAHAYPMRFGHRECLIKARKTFSRKTTIDP